jgi:hypothetical protein
LCFTQSFDNSKSGVFLFEQYLLRGRQLCC